ncbi:copper homeostasis cutc [Trichoderma arundinaceum]|uniref:Copper homeostasis protein cutC homolog n=1 Tax=Trichoderma arundinaceum TaxID=490622 RepID=A0A395NCK6_TRIAR|nr:copper homeostasis cutc [Trichoderma arundinaceum]
MPTPIDLGQSTRLNCEVAVFSGASGLEAQDLGAKRIELNAPGSYGAGGLTPPVKELTSIASQLHIAVRIMIRPRGAPQVAIPQQGEGQDPDPDQELQDFIYTDDEIELMLKSIIAFKETRVLNPIRGDGFVFGILKRQTKPSTLAKYPDLKYTIDEERCKMLIDAARPFPCVFHRAFDPIAASERWAKGIDILVRCGFDGVLTSGGIGNCGDHLEKLDAICHRAAPGSLQVVAGGGVRRNNVREAVARLSVHGTKSVWVHTASLADKIDKDGRRIEQLNGRELTAIISVINATSPD